MSGHTGLEHYLTAIVSGPACFETGEWIRPGFGEPLFCDAGQVQDVPGLIVRLHAGTRPVSNS